MSLILAFESSCDDTSVAIVDTNFRVLVNLVSTQTAHADFGGILPELASRLHQQNILHLTNTALEQTGFTQNDIDAIAVSINPGLIGSLIVGLSFTKGLAWSWQKPLIVVNHMLSHIFANFIEHTDIQPPFLALVVSGGHTELIHFQDLTAFKVVGKTLDDAAGETFDKTAKLLGLGFPGGPIIDEMSHNRNPSFFAFPRALKMKDNFNFSYSGLKTAVAEYLSKQTPEFVQAHLADLAASIQQAIIDPLISKSIGYAVNNGIKTILLAGGVAANTSLRSQLSQKASKNGMTVYSPAPKYCMDNAAMVGIAAVPKYHLAQFADLEVNAFSSKGIRVL